MTRPIDVFILTYCRNLELFYGTSLVFRTLRIGFPNALVHVVDNASLPEAKSELARLAKENDCLFEAVPDPGVQHHQFIEQRLYEAARRSKPGAAVVFVDPDVCLWKDCEGLEFDRMVAGLYLEAYDDEVMQCVTMPRLHTSFLWLTDPARLVGEIERLKRTHIDFQPFLPLSVKLGDAWLRYDTGASLYAAMPEQCQPFDEVHLEHYDHIYAGSHFDLWRGLHPGELRDFMASVHDRAKEGDLDALRGLWRRQRELWYRSVRILRSAGDLGDAQSGEPG